MKLKVILLTLCLFVLSACQLPNRLNPSETSSTSHTVGITAPNGEELRIELAQDNETRANGLMYREQLDKNAGMAFIFERERQLSFWMKNTLIPLDILYINAEGVVVDIQTMSPCPAEEQRCPSYLSSEPALYAIELNEGAAEKYGFEVGSKVEVSSFK